jgi:5-methylcytosine-specific restriction endonuclease McrA
VKKGSQRVLYCACGRSNILAHGLCPTCYTLKRRDMAYFGGLREEVLKRDGYTCQGCGAPGRRKRSITVHHRQPGVSLLSLMISLCPKCHAKVERTQMVLSEMNPLLLELWREKHPQGLEQFALDFGKYTESCPCPRLPIYLNATIAAQTNAPGQISFAPNPRREI